MTAQPITAQPPVAHQSGSSPQNQQLQSARDSLTTTIANYSKILDSIPALNPLHPLIQTELDKLITTLEKLENKTIRIAAFGLVSRGKSAVLNALVGDRLLETGPINGITQSVKVLKWIPNDAANIQIELLDTPGLDEVEGQARETMAKEVAAQSDLILFITAGDMTRTEYDALCDLRSAQKPLILVFNKIDLYPEVNRNSIYQNLVTLGERSLAVEQLQQLLTEDEIALIAADPAAVQVRIEHTDGRIEYEWEKPATEITDLNQKLLTILNREGRSLLALNALTQSRQAELRMAEAVIETRKVEAEALIQQFLRYKAISIGLSPFGFVDFVGGAMADLSMVRALSKLYGLPMTRFEAGNLLKSLLLSSGGLLLSELLSWLSLGQDWDGGTIAPFIGMGLLQAGIAAYGTYRVGRSAQDYLEQGSTWGSNGANTVIREILSQVDRNTIIYRIREELSA